MRDPWYAEMGRKNRERERQQAEAEREARYVPPPGPPPHNCGECYEWQFDLIQDDGTPRWLWFRVCDRNTCQHAHHEGEVWMAAVGQF